MISKNNNDKAAATFQIKPSEVFMKTLAPIILSVLFLSLSGCLDSDLTGIGVNMPASVALPSATGHLTKIDDSGQILNNQATEWSCVSDSTTHLMWEVKSAYSVNLNYYNSLFTWYDSASGLGTEAGSGAVSEKYCYYAGRCDTEKYVEDINSSALCGYNDWRLPSATELKTIIKASEKSVDITIQYPEINPSFDPLPTQCENNGGTYQCKVSRWVNQYFFPYTTTKLWSSSLDSNNDPIAINSEVIDDSGNPNHTDSTTSAVSSDTRYGVLLVRDN